MRVRVCVCPQVIEGGNNKKQKPAYGADVLRLWVSSVDYSGDVCVGDHIIKQVRSLAFCCVFFFPLLCFGGDLTGPKFGSRAD